jgi:sarcosine oxidase
VTSRPGAPGGRRPSSRTATVVGAGVVGLSIARELAGRGWSVRIVDTDDPGTRGPSAAETRILRFSHGDDSWYPALAQRARVLWQALEQKLRIRLLVPCGVLVMGPPPPDQGFWELASARRLDALGIPVEVLDGRTARRRFSEFDPRGSGTLLFEPHGAVLLARQATLALAQSARDLGAELIRGNARPKAGRALVDGQAVPAEVTVWAIGTALPVLFPGLSSVREVQQDSWYLQPQGTWAADRGSPAWLDRALGYYGVPAVGTLGVKVVPDQEIQPEAPGGRPAGRPPDSFRGYLSARLPDLAHAPVLRHERCSYALTRDEHFLLARHPDHPGTWIVGGDSGHGFKHGPAWGEYVCNVIEGQSAAEARFCLR